MDADPWVIWICDRCAKVNGGSFPEGHMATFHKGQCDVCFCHTVVTEPRDYRLWGLNKPRNHPDISTQPTKSPKTCTHEWTGIPTTEESWCIKCGIESHEV